MSAVFKREFKAYFQTPIGWIFLAAIYFFLGLYFYIIYSTGSPDMSAVILSMSTIMVFAMPIITMRLMSEDRRQKVDQALLTAPLKLSGLVLGKFWAALSLFALGFAPTVIFEVIILSHLQVGFVAYIYSLFGILLLGGALIAIGMFISSLTENPVVSAIVSLIINFVALYMTSFAEMVKVGWISTVLKKAAFMNAFQSFGESMFSIANIVYFLSIIAAFLFLCTRVLEKRRWA